MKVIVKDKAVTFRRKVYASGDEVDLPDKIAKHLVAAGVCKAPIKKKSVTEKPKINIDEKSEAKKAKEGDKKC